MDVVEPAGQAAPVAIERPAADPGVAGPPIPGDDPVMERKAERRQVLVDRRARGQALEDRAEVVAEEADQAAEEGRDVGRDERRRVEPGDQAAGDGEGVGSGRRRLEDGHRIGREIGPACVAARPGALQQDEAGQVAERLGGVDRAHRGDAVGQPAHAKRRAGAGYRDHGPMIGPPARVGPRRVGLGAGSARRSSGRVADPASIPGCGRATWGSRSGAASPARSTRSPTSPACASGSRR